MSDPTANSYLVLSQTAALTLTGPAKLATRGLADLCGNDNAERMFRRAMMFRHGACTGKEFKDQCIKLLQQTLALEPGHLPARTLLGIAYSAQRDVEESRVAAVQLFQEAANQGYAHAQLCLASSFLNGDGVPQDTLRAVEWFRKAAESGYGVAQYELGCLLYDPDCNLGQNDYGKQIGPAEMNLREAAKWYERAEAQGDEWAAFRLAHMYRNVEPQSPKKAALWERKGNELQHGDYFRHHSSLDTSRISSRMLGGVCPPIDKSTEIETRISMAAEQGDPDALIAIGCLYERGECISTAVDWYDRAAKRGNNDALVRLAWFYFDGRGIIRDRAHAFELFRCAADQGDFRAQVQLAWMYENGVGVDCNKQIGRELTRKTEETTNTHRLHELAFMYGLGNGVERSEKKAAELYRKAAELGDRFAQYEVGKSYAQGKGVAKDYTMAASWYRKAAEQNESEAQYSLAILYLEGKGISKDADEAVRWCCKAAEQDNPDALLLLARLYESGTGVPRDSRQAIEMYVKVRQSESANGYMVEEAKDALKRLRNMVESDD